jgi:hypothetical protein
VVWRVKGQSLGWDAIDKYHNAFSPDGMAIAILREPNSVRFLAASSGELLGEYVGAPKPEETAYSLGYSSNGLLAIGRYGLVQVYDGHPLPERLLRGFFAERATIGSVAFSPDGTLIAFQRATTHEERQRGIGSVFVRDVRTGATVAELQASAAIAQVEFSADGRSLMAIHRSAAEEEQDGIRVWRTSDWELQREWAGGRYPAFAGGSIQGSDLVVVYETNGRLEMRDVSDGRMIWSVPLIPAQFAPQPSRVLGTKLACAAISPDGRYIVTYESAITFDVRGNASGGIVVRRAESGRIVAVYDVAGVMEIKQPCFCNFRDPLAG